MRLTLVIRTGDDAGRTIEVRPGPPTRVGRDAPCEVRLRGDSMLSNPHFALSLDESGPRLRDLGSRFGTFRNNVKVTDSELHDGDTIRAGQTEFGVRLEGAPAEAPGAAAPDPAAVQPPAPAKANGSVPLPSRQPARDLMKILRGTPGLYGLLDAARERTIPYRLAEAKVAHESLYDGPQGLAIAHVGPWVTHLPEDSPLLTSLVRDGWGKSWGVFLACDQPLAEVRHHLRRFLLVKLPGAKAAYFRYYDPRVLRVYLPTCNAEELKQFFGPFRGYFCEGDEPGELLLFTPAQAEPVRFEVVAAHEV